MNQAFEILRYLGRKHGFYDDTDFEESHLVDWTLETVTDLQVAEVFKMNFAPGFFKESTEEDLEAAKANFIKLH